MWQHCECVKIDHLKVKHTAYTCQQCCSLGSSPKPKKMRMSRKKVSREQSREVELTPQPPNSPPGHKYFSSLLTSQNFAVKLGLWYIYYIVLNNNQKTKLKNFWFIYNGRDKRLFLVFKYMLHLNQCNYLARLFK